MSFLSISEIDFLVARKYPRAPERIIPPTRPAPRGTSATLPGGRWEEFENAQRYRSELTALPPDELRQRYDAERAKWQAENTAQLDREENGRPFNHPSANADFDYWSRMPHWSLDEAIALSFGKAPERVSWKTIGFYIKVSPFAVRYARVRELASRACVWKQLFDPVVPSLFIAWTERMELGFPAKLKEMALARGDNLKDWPSFFQEMKEAKDKAIATLQELTRRQATALDEIARQRDHACAQSVSFASELAIVRQELESARAEPKEKGLGARERESLLKITIGIAMGGYRYDPRSSRNQATSEIVNDLEGLGVGIDAETLRKFLREGAQLLPGDDPSKPA